MQRSERRRGAVAGLPSHVLERQLNDAQRHTLRGLEAFGLSLAFVRKPLFREPIAVVRDPTKQTYVVIEADGSIIEDVELDTRH